MDKKRDNGLKWIGHMIKRGKTEAVRAVMIMYANVDEKRERGRPKKR